MSNSVDGISQKPTREQYRERVDICAKMLAARVRTGDIKRVLKVKYGVTRSTVQRYLSRARKQMLLETGKPKVEHVADAFCFYDSVKADQNQDIRARLVAQEGIVNLLGLADRFGPRGGDVTVNVGVAVKTEELLREPEYLEYVRSRVGKLANADTWDVRCNGGERSLEVSASSESDRQGSDRPVAGPNGNGRPGA